MLQLRTQIYLEPTQHAALLREARDRGLSLAGVIRKLVDEHFLRQREKVPGLEDRKKAALSLIGLGRSGLGDVSEKADIYLGDAIYGAKVHERRAAYKNIPRKK